MRSVLIPDRAVQKNWQLYTINCSWFAEELRGVSEFKRLSCSPQHRLETPHVPIQGRVETSASEVYPKRLCDGVFRASQRILSVGDKDERLIQIYVEYGLHEEGYAGELAKVPLCAATVLCTGILVGPAKYDGDILAFNRSKDYLGTETAVL